MGLTRTPNIQNIQVQTILEVSLVHLPRTLW